jgi:hypothetical protein
MEIKERFGLKRNSLLLDPIEDSDFYAPRSDIDVNQLVESLRIDLEAGITPKMVFWGPYGGGKTHTLGKVQKSLAKLTPVHCVYIRCPTLSERDVFAEFYQTTFSDGFGEDFTINLLWELCDQLIKKYGLRDTRVDSEMRSILGDEELAKATSHLSDRSFEKGELWRWISGVKMSPTELKKLGVARSLYEVEPLRLARFIETIGRLLQHLQGKRLVLTYDEMDRIKDLKAEAALTFRTAFTHLMDPGQPYVSIFFGFSADSTKGIPELMKGPVIDRVGGEVSESVKEIPTLDPKDVEAFIIGVLDYLRDPSADIESMVKKAQKETKEKLTKQLYPFTEEALAEMKGKTAKLTPRSIMFTLSRAMSRANIQNKNAVTREYIR